MFHYTLISMHRGKQTEGNTDNKLMILFFSFRLYVRHHSIRNLQAFLKKLGFGFLRFVGIWRFGNKKFWTVVGEDSSSRYLGIRTFPTFGTGRNVAVHVAKHVGITGA